MDMVAISGCALRLPQWLIPPLVIQSICFSQGLDRRYQRHSHRAFVNCLALCHCRCCPAALRLPRTPLDSCGPELHVRVCCNWAGTLQIGVQLLIQNFFLCYSMIQQFIISYSALLYFIVYYSILLYVIVCYSILQYIIVYCAYCTLWNVMVLQALRNITLTQPLCSILQPLCSRMSPLCDIMQPLCSIMQPCEHNV